MQGRPHRTQVSRGIFGGLEGGSLLGRGARLAEEFMHLFWSDFEVDDVLILLARGFLCLFPPSLLREPLRLLLLLCMFRLVLIPLSLLLLAFCSLRGTAGSGYGSSFG